VHHQSYGRSTTTATTASSCNSAAGHSSHRCSAKRCATRCSGCTAATDGSTTADYATATANSSASDPETEADRTPRESFVGVHDRQSVRYAGLILYREYCRARLAEMRKQLLYPHKKFLKPVARPASTSNPITSTAGCCPNQATRFREFRTPDPPNGLGLFRLDTLGT
jgi:hypothetical protein